ncbi:HNH endonuclease [Stenotrophomonas maltophilia]|nr:HNH endonuclease [Stenotrophomonas maltophilia]
MTVARTELARTYRFKETEELHREDIAQDLWHAVESVLATSVQIDCLRSGDELTAIVSERVVNYVYSRMVISGCYWMDLNGVPSDQLVLVDGMVQALRDVLDVPDGDLEQRIAYMLARVCTRVRQKHAKLNDTQIGAIRNFAAVEGHRCYLCGADLHYEAHRPYGDDSDDGIDRVRDQRSFEIEHIWNQARGGSRAPSNLAACCKACNKHKSHLISFVDLPIEQINSGAKRPESILTSINNQYRFSIIWKQHGRCARCDRHFYEIDSESLYLVKREYDQPLHFLNLEISCGQCNNDLSLKGVKIRA